MNNTLLILFGVLLLIHILVRTYTNNKAKHQSLSTYFLSTYIYAGLTFAVRAVSLVMLIDAYHVRDFVAMAMIGVVYATSVAIGGMFIMWLQKKEQKRYELSADMAKKADAILKERAHKSATKTVRRTKRGKKR